MITWRSMLLTIFAILAMLTMGAYWYQVTKEQREPSRLAFADYCATCHGEDLSGSELGPSLLSSALANGASVDALMRNIGSAQLHDASRPWMDELTPEMIKAVALFVIEKREGYPLIADSYTPGPMTAREIRSQHHVFRLEPVAELSNRPYSLAPLPDGRLLVAEKTRGLAILEPGGNDDVLIAGTPRVWNRLLSVSGAWLNWGSLLDVALHPNYADNGWIYLSHTDRCQWDCGWPIPASMVRVIRGRIIDGQWRDEELIWSVSKAHYTPVPDGVAAGRLAFDGQGYVFVSVGGKNTYDKLHDLNTPFGKVHRVFEDGSIPEDNPFFLPEAVRAPDSTIHTVWSYGHRTGQGLDGHPANHEIWNTEMGPRGGDEINLIKGGGNYGWPLYTNGLDYDGTRITIGEDLGLDFPLEDTELPVVDWTPAPAISNFTFHNGSAFPSWEDDLLVGTLKASTLYRLRIREGVLVEQEKLVVGIGRIRDVAMGFDGRVYLALEHGEAGSVWRLAPLSMEPGP